MRWPWSRRPRNEAGLADAQERLDAARDAEREVARVVRQLRQIRERNNFAALVAAAFKEHR